MANNRKQRVYFGAADGVRSHVAIENAGHRPLWPVSIRLNLPDSGVRGTHWYTVVIA